MQLALPKRRKVSRIVSNGRPNVAGTLPHYSYLDAIGVRWPSDGLGEPQFCDQSDVEYAREFLKTCTEVRRDHVCSRDVATYLGMLAGRTIPNGAVIKAALLLGLHATTQPYQHPNAFFRIAKSDLAKLRARVTDDAYLRAKEQYPNKTPRVRRRSPSAPRNLQKPLPETGGGSGGGS